jgi:hypothetical protein
MTELEPPSSDGLPIRTFKRPRASGVTPVPKKCGVRRRPKLNWAVDSGLGNVRSGRSDDVPYTKLFDYRLPGFGVRMISIRLRVRIE